MELGASKDLKNVAAVVGLLVEMKDTEEGQAVIKGVVELGAVFKPVLVGLHRLSTQLDIEAMQTMQAAGFTFEQSLALRRSAASTAPSLGKLFEAMQKQYAAKQPKQPKQPTQ